MSTITRKVEALTAENLGTVQKGDCVRMVTLFGAGLWQVVEDATVRSRGNVNLRLAHPTGSTFSVCLGPRNIPAGSDIVRAAA